MPLIQVLLFYFVVREVVAMHGILSFLTSICHFSSKSRAYTVVPFRTSRSFAELRRLVTPIVRQGHFEETPQYMMTKSTRARTGTKRKVNDAVDPGDSVKANKSQGKGKGKNTEKTTDEKDVVLSDDNDSEVKKKASTKKSPSHQVLTQRHELPKLWGNTSNDSNSYTFKVCSWNVAGLRALLRNHPDTLESLVKDHAIDVLCLQETKLQDIHLEDTKLQIRDTLLQPDYDAYYSCSKAKKGYSGTAVFIRRHDVKNSKAASTLDKFFVTSKKAELKATPKAVPLSPDMVAKLTPLNVSYTIGVDSHDQEGRIVVVDFPQFSLINCYVPNSGQKLERLKYRTEEWDKDFLNFVTSKDKPTIWLGDLNVAHTNLEVWNDGAKHLATQAGVTKEERESFQHQLDSSGFVDAFRRLHPNAEGCYTYWSQRAGNRLPNKGLRLDYFCCAPSFFDDESLVVARDSYMLYDVLGSDHCPIILELEIKA